MPTLGAMNKSSRTLISTVRLGVVALLTFSSLSSTSITRAQQPTRGNISGVVNDVSSALVSEAEVSLVNAQQAVLTRTRTDAQGRFAFRDVRPGSYVILISR